MERIGIFGGTFNPVHSGHLLLARHYLDALKLDRLLVIPTGTPPHKDAPELLDGEKRMQLCALAFEDQPQVQLCDIELRREGKSFTVDTVGWLRQQYPQAQLYLLGMLIMKVSPEELSVCFIAFLLAVPLLFVMPPVQHISNILFFAVIFIGLVLHVKTGRIAVIDITDCVVFGMVSSIISSFMMVSMHQNFLSELRLRRFANFDILTNMQNRNAYESSRDSWAKKCTVSLSCVYVDVNGLHELNNASGHEKGDQMLQTVALELQGRFGRDNCYRTGGDEFVAFVQDEPETAVRAATDELIRELERKGCSAAIGVVTQNAGSMDLDTLIRQAEQQMYQAKEEHYRIQRQLEH